MDKYIICPRCNLNYMLIDADICNICIDEVNPQRKKTQSKKMETDFSVLLSGRNYGTSSKEIYKKLCDSLGWDLSKSNQFGWQTWMYAEKADTDRTRDVWFIYHSNYTDSVCDSAKWANKIVDDRIYEAYIDNFPKPSGLDRITFAKNKRGDYEFLGVYTIIHTDNNGRVYKRVSDCYPIESK